MINLLKNVDISYLKDHVDGSLNVSILYQRRTHVDLFQVNPRKIMSIGWFDSFYEQKKNYSYCACCAIELAMNKIYRTQLYNYDDEKKIIEFVTILPLCAKCFCFIHGGGGINNIAMKEITCHVSRLLNISEYEVLRLYVEKEEFKKKKGYKLLFDGKIYCKDNIGKVIVREYIEKVKKVMSFNCNHSSRMVDISDII